MDKPARKRAAVETYARNEAILRSTACRYSLCEDDADDALQRGLEILLRKAPTDDPRELVKWMQTVVKREAMAIRRERERILGTPQTRSGARTENWIDRLPARSPDPAERIERREAVARSREALQALKPQELRALSLLAEGYSYVEIGEITGYSPTKINRCLAEGRERYRRLVARSEDGRRCAELQPLISAFCDGEAGPTEAVQVREHLRVCAHCRSTLRTYRAAPAAAAALAPVLPLERSLWERAQDALAGAVSRFGGGGAGGLGVTGVAKVAAICVGTAGGAAACVAAGVLPAPLDASPDRQGPQLEHRLAELPAAEASTPTVEYAPAPVESQPDPKPERKPKPDASAEQPAENEPAAEPVVESTPVSSDVEYAPPPAPEPVAEPAPAPSSSGGGSPAGEFGP